MSNQKNPLGKRLFRKDFSFDLSDELTPDTDRQADLNGEKAPPERAEGAALERDGHRQREEELGRTDRLLRIFQQKFVSPQETPNSRRETRSEQGERAERDERENDIERNVQDERADHKNRRDHRGRRIEREHRYDEPKGMSFFERVDARARMRRREQTRQRREAKRGIRAGDSAYPVMTAADVRMTLLRLIASLALLLLGAAFKEASFVFYLLAYLMSVLPVVLTVARNFTHGHYVDEALLMFLVSLGAFLLKHRPEASVTLLLYRLRKLLCDMVLSATRETLDQQADTTPKTASVVNLQGEEKNLPPKDVPIGSFIMLRSGETVPVDGEVLRGEGTLNLCTLTGNNTPIPVTKGNRVFAGGVYTGSLMLLRSVSLFEDCAISRTHRLHAKPSKCRAGLEESVQRIVTHYIPFALMLAVLVTAVPPLFHFGTLTDWLYRALICLLLCSPASLTVSVPLSFTGGVTRLLQKGIHLRGSAVIERLAELRMVVFGKTGTLTEGALHVKKVLPAEDITPETCLALAATAEQKSNHPAARAVLAAYQGELRKLTDAEEYPGRGVRALVGRRTLLAGNRKLLIAHGIRGVPELGGTVVYTACENDYVGAVVLEDAIRPEAAKAVSLLKEEGVVRTVILTGDAETPTQVTADTIGIDTVHSGLSPEEKVSKMEFLVRTIPTDGSTAYVGNGLSDLEELKIADVGITMGFVGVKESADAADVLVLSNDLRLLPNAVRVCRLAHNAALQNMVLLLGMKVVLIAMTLFGITTMWQATAIDVLLTILAVLNAARVQKV